MSGSTKASDWKHLPLIDVATLQRGFDLPVQDRTSGDVPIFAANGLIGTHNVGKIRGPVVVTGRSGTIGKVHFVESDYWPLNTSLFVKDFHENDPKFVFYLLSSFGLEKYHEGTGVPTLNRNNVHSVLVPAPPLAEQTRIAAILDQADALRRKRRQALELAKTFPVSLFAAMFPCSDKSVRLATLENAVERFIDYRGKTPAKTTSGVPLITAKVIKEGRILDPEEFISVETYDSWMRRGLPNIGDVLFTTEAPLGEVAQLMSNRVALAQRVLLLRGKPDELDNGYLKFVLKVPDVWKQIITRSSGSTVKGIRQKELRKVTIPLPPIGRQREFTELVRSHDASQQRTRASSLTLDHLFSSLLHRAFRGEL